MIKYIIKLDYILAVWFAKKKKKVIPGTVFLLLNKVSFLWVGVCSFLMSLINDMLSVTVMVSIVMLGSAIIMYGLQKPIESNIEAYISKKELKKYSKRKLKIKRLEGLLLFLFSFALMFVVVVLSFR